MAGPWEYKGYRISAAVEKETDQSRRETGAVANLAVYFSLNYNGLSLYLDFKMPRALAEQMAPMDLPEEVVVREGEAEVRRFIDDGGLEPGQQISVIRRL